MAGALLSTLLVAAGACLVVGILRRSGWPWIPALLLAAALGPGAAYGLLSLVCFYARFAVDAPASPPVLIAGLVGLSGWLLAASWRRRPTAGVGTSGAPPRRESWIAL
ncbi:MAG: hypothetical protein MI919_12480, partial [Holophagales bacterium]|nr:hypothetical protein [Holophagales bacterium]